MNPNISPADRIFFPLDTTNLEKAVQTTKNLKKSIGGVKIGKEFFTALGPDGVMIINNLDVPVFLDLKFHDIPNTVAGAVRSALKLKPRMLNVHASGGREMLIAARDTNLEFSEKENITPPLILGVTVLTSMNAKNLNEIGISGKSLDQVKRLASLCQECGLDGVVCSPSELSALRRICGSTFKLVTPGVRPSWAPHDDQKRVATPGEAIKQGADYLVIGRPISGAPNPLIATNNIIDEIVRCTVSDDN